MGPTPGTANLAAEQAVPSYHSRTRYPGHYRLATTRAVDAVSAYRPAATTAGFTVTVRGRRVYLVDAEPTSDPDMGHHEATELAQRLLHAAGAAERADQQPPARRPA